MLLCLWTASTTTKSVCSTLFNLSFKPQTFNHQPISRLFHSSKPFLAVKKKMPPKKQAAEEKILLGRPGNNLKMVGGFYFIHLTF